MKTNQPTVKKIEAGKISSEKIGILNLWRLIPCFLVAVVLSSHTAIAKSGGTDILHFISKSDMVNTGVEPDARGKIDVMMNQQGNASKQQLEIVLSKLNPSTDYRLIVFVGDATNAMDVTVFTTDKKGSFTISYSDKGRGNLSKDRKALADALNPICKVRELDVVNGNTNAVLRAILSNPEKGQYMVKETMKNVGFLPSARGDLRIKANAKSTQFLLKVSGLTPNVGYSLGINGEVIQAYTSDNLGKLIVNRLPLSAPSALEIQSLELTDNLGTNLVLITVGLGIPCTLAHQVSPSLGAAGAGFTVLAGSTVANTGLTMINGDLGLSPGSAVTGFPPGVVTGMQHVADMAAAQAKLELTVAYNDAAGRTVGAITVAGNLGGLTLPPGLYKSTSSLEISSGDLTLDAQGDANAVFIFQIASTLTTTSGRQVILSGGAKAANVFWQVGSSATLGTTSVFKGTIMADQSITLATGATLEGRALTRVAAVTLDANVITIPAQ